MGEPFHQENPFEEATVASEWITSVENEKEGIRDKEIYPLLKTWIAEKKPGLMVDIGCGQGICAEQMPSDIPTTYVGIEPSASLVDRAQEKYAGPNKKFVRGDAYALPIESGKADAAFSVNVWFHLADLNLAASELHRILKPNGSFLIVTANPKAYETWETFYFDSKKEGKRIIGKVNVPVNPLSANTFYEHSLEELKDSLEAQHLTISKIDELGELEKGKPKLFIAISGHKS